MSTIMYKDIEYGGSGGGGTEVIPNPAGQPLADLNKLQINNDIYRIPSGGSGSDVSITPTLAEGTKIADFEIDGVEGELFVPDSSKVYVKYTKPADSEGKNGDLAVIIPPNFTYELIDEMGGWELDSYSINNDGSYNFTFTGLTDTSASEDNSVLMKINGFGNTGSYNVKCKIKFEGNMGGAWNQALGPALFADPTQSANGYSITQAQAGTFIRIGGDDGGIINIDWDQDWHNYDYNFDYHSSSNNLYIRLATARNYIYGQTDSATIYVENFLITGDTSTVTEITKAYSKVNGHWIEMELGGSGASAISELTDVQLTNLADGQILKYDSTTQKWINADEDTDYTNLTNKPSINSISLSGNKTSSDLGIVITLTQAQYNALTSEEKNDPNKVYYVTDAPGGGADSLEDLEDVDINNLTNGQILKYNSTSQQWENEDENPGTVVIANPQETPTEELTAIQIGNDVYSVAGGTSDTELIELTQAEYDLLTPAEKSDPDVLYLITDAGGGGGGGTTVIANPTGTPTDQLDTVQIGNTIYEIVGGGSSSGGMTVLDDIERTDLNTSFELSDAITNYDAILVNIYYTGGSGYPIVGSTVLSVAELADHSYQAWIDGGNNDRALRIEFTDSTHYQIGYSNGDNGIHGVYGLKFGGGGSGGSSSEIIQISAGDGALSRTFTFTKTPKFIQMDWVSEIPWYFTTSFTWGAERAFFIANNSSPVTGSIYTGVSTITYGADGKSFTITGANKNCAANGEDASGQMYVQY